MSGRETAVDYRLSSKYILRTFSVLSTNLPKVLCLWRKTILILQRPLAISFSFVPSSEGGRPGTHQTCYCSRTDEVVKSRLRAEAASVAFAVGLGARKRRWEIKVARQVSRILSFHRIESIVATKQEQCFSFLSR